MQRHPAGKRRVSGLVSEARWQQAQELANRLLVEAEEYSGSPVVPESPEVRWQRETDEACALASLNAEPRPEPARPVWEAVKAFGGGMALFGGLWGLTVCSSIAGELAGGWPL